MQIYTRVRDGVREFMLETVCFAEAFARHNSDSQSVEISSNDPQYPDSDPGPYFWGPEDLIELAAFATILNLWLEDHQQAEAAFGMKDSPEWTKIGPDEDQGDEQESDEPLAWAA